MGLKEEIQKKYREYHKFMEANVSKKVSKREYFTNWSKISKKIKTLKEHLCLFADKFDKIQIGRPLLTFEEDYKACCDIVMKYAPAPKEETALVFMGHGTPHDSNSVYTELDQRLKELGYPQVFMGTVEAEPSLDTLLEKIQTLHVKRVILAPFMVVAGDHAINDMSGDEEDSWKSTFEKAGYEVECILKGLGEYPAVRQIYVKHALEA